MIQFNCEVEAIQSRKDNTLKIVLGTQELKEGAKLFSLQNKLCTIGIVPNLELTTDDIALLQSAKLGMDDLPTGKSQSQRLRNVLWIYSQQKGVPKEDFNDFYFRQMDKLIEHYKSKLEPNQ